MKKPWTQLVKESFKKTLDERYAEASKNERIAYWVWLAVIVGIMFFMWNSK